MTEEDEKMLAAETLAGEIDMRRYNFGLYGGLALNIESGHKFMNVVNTSKLTNKDHINWLDKSGSPVEVDIDDALTICDSLINSYGRSLAGDQSLVDLHIDAYKASNLTGATAQNLKRGEVKALTASEIAAAKVACNAPSS